MVSPHRARMCSKLLRDRFERSFRARPQRLACAELPPERTLLAGGSPFDRYWYGHNTAAMSGNQSH
jgi:hypothetical protein